MLSIAHTATGALIATKIGNPLISIPLIIASHYLLDTIPHWDVGTGLSSGRKSSSAAFQHELIDLAISGFVVYFLFQSGSAHINFSAWGGAFTALIPDFLEVPENFLNLDIKQLRPLNRFHHSIHHSIPDVLGGLIPQFILLLLIAIFSGK